MVFQLVPLLLLLTYFGLCAAQERFLSLKGCYQSPLKAHKALNDSSSVSLASSPSLPPVYPAPVSLFLFMAFHFFPLYLGILPPNTYIIFTFTSYTSLFQCHLPYKAFSVSPLYPSALPVFLCCFIFLPRTYDLMYLRKLKG